MAVVANVAINVDAGSAISQLNAVDRAAGQVAATAAKSESAIGKLSRAFSGLGGVVASIGSTALLRNIAQAGIQAGTTDVRIRQLTKSFGEYGAAQKIIAGNAQTFNLSQNQAAKGFADIYARLRPVGVSLENINKVYRGFNTAAAQSGLTATQAAPAFTQLAQALGSGALRGDEFNSIAEQVPGILGAIAKTMGVPVGALRDLAAEGKITSDVVIKSLGDLARSGEADLSALAESPAGTVAKFQQAAENLQTTIGTKLLPAFTPLIKGLTDLINGFNQLPQPVQAFIAGAAGLAIAVGAVAAPIGFMIQGLAALGPAFAAIGGAISGAIGLLTGGGGLGAALGAVITLLTGPVGWVIAIGAAVAALIAFREPIGQFVKDAVEGFGYVVSFVNDNFVGPIIQGIGRLIEGIRQAFGNVVDFIVAPFKSAFAMVRGVVNNIISGVERAINGVVQGINRMIQGANNVASKIGLPQIGYLPTVGLPRFADGGVVNKPTVAMVGEGGEPEYIIPASKMDEAMSRYASGQRGSSVIPSSINPQVNVTTGPVMNMNGSNYVSQNDFLAGMQTASRRGAEMALQTLQGNNSARRAVGIR